MKWEYVPAVPLKDFDVEKSLANQARFTVLDPAVVETYTEAVRRGDQFPAGLPGNGPSRADGDARAASRHAVAWAVSHRVAAGFLVGVSPGSTRAYTTDLRDLFGFARRAGVPPLLLDRPGLEGYLRHLLVGRGLAAATVARRCSALAGYYRYAVQEGVLGTDPMTRVRRPAVPDNAPTFTLDAGHGRALLAAAAAHSPRAHALVAVLLVTGCRIGELLGADTTDLGHETGYRTLRVRRKGGAPDALLLPGPVAEVVDAYLGPRDTGPLLVTRTGARWDRTGASRLLHKLADATLPAAVAARFRPHACRVAAIGLAVDAGVDLRDIAAGAGHARLATTWRYVVRRRELARLPAHAVAAVLQPGLGSAG